MPNDREVTERKSKKCNKRIFAGLFMFTSGIAILLNIIINQLVEALNPDWQSVIGAITSSIIILWIFGGFWLFLYGLASPCPEPLDY